MFVNSSKFLFASSMIVGVMVSICSNNWFMIWSGLEISLMSFIPLMSGFNMLSSESMLKYFLVQSLSSSILLLGMIFTLLGLKDMTLTMVFGISMKLGLAPFHNWMLVMVDGLSYQCNFILLSIMKISPLTLISYLNYNLTILIIFSLIVGSIFGLNQSSIRKILSFSSIYNLSFMISSISYNSVWLSYLFIYSLMLLCVISFFSKFNINYINQVIMNEISIMMKISIWIVLLSMAGMPPMVGFMMKLMIFEFLINHNEIMILVLMIITSMLINFYYMRLMYLCLMFSSLEFKWKKNYIMNNTLIYLVVNVFLTTVLLMYKVML
uniref:NADH-ubiquinone oxidoreductase chain 2 n=1 Tax=Cicadella viridis TaxID=36150 RepID=A0A6B9P500_CICVR|nr:NADH dehydrogenase subunit 2 [Cicadella viridis]